MERLKAMKENLMNSVQAQISGNLDCVDTKELGEAVDMIKDLSEAIYYCSITEAMEKNEKEQKIEDKVREKMAYERNMQSPEWKKYSTYLNPYYLDRDMDLEYGRMYYSGKDNRDRMMMKSYQPEREGNYYTRDVREGRSPLSRKMYMESKELHHDKATQMKELENYMQELTQDITEMIHDATPEEKQILQQKISVLASKIK